MRGIDVKKVRMMGEKVLIFRHFFIFRGYLRGPQYAAFLYAETNRNKTRNTRNQN